MADLSKAMEQFAEVVGRAMGVTMSEAHANVKRIADSMMLQTATNTKHPHDALIQRYQNDALFHAIVDTLANWIRDAQTQPAPNVTSDDLRAACECAVLVSQVKATPTFVGIWPSEDEDAIELFTIDLDEARRSCRRGLTCLACEYWSPLAVNPPTPGRCAVDDPSVAYQPDDPACGYFKPKHRMCASCAHWNSAAHRCGLPPDSRHSGTKQANDGRQCPDFCEASVPKMMARGFNAIGTKPSALQYAKAKPDDVVDANPRMTAVALAGRRHGKTQANRALEEAIDALKKREQVEAIAQMVQMNAMTPADAKRSGRSRNPGVMDGTSRPARAIPSAADTARRRRRQP